MEETSALLQALAKVIDKNIKPHGFVLLTVAPAGTAEAGSRVNYVSSCDRADMIAAMKEIVARLEGQPRVRGRA